MEKKSNTHHFSRIVEGYHDAQRDFQGVNGHGFDDSTHLADKENYQAGYRTGWNDAQKGVSGPFC
jgi:hypothetical protein